MAADEEILITLKVDTTESAKSLKQLRTEYKEQLKELEGLTVGTKEYIDALSKIGGIKDEIGDLNDTIKAFNPEGKVQAFGNVIGGLASGIQGAVGAMALFGVESEETQKMLLKVQAASAFAEGIKGVIGLGDSFKNLQLVLGKTVIGQKLVTAGQWLWNAAISANPIGLIIIALAALVAGIGYFIGSTNDAEAAQERLTKKLEAENKALKEGLDLLELKNSQRSKDNKAIIAQLQAEGKSEAEILAFKIKASIDEEEAVKKVYSTKYKLYNNDKEVYEKLRKLKKDSSDEDDIKELSDLKAKLDAAFIETTKASDARKEAKQATDNLQKEGETKERQKRLDAEKTAGEKGAADKKVIDDKAAADKKANDAKILASTTQLIEDTKKLKEDEELRLAANDEIRLGILKERELVLLQEQFDASNKSLEAQQAYTDAELAIDHKYMDDVNTLRIEDGIKKDEQNAADLLKAQELKTAQLELKSTTATTEYEQLVAQGSLGLALSVDLAQKQADAELAVLEDKRARGLISEQESADAKAKIEEDLQAKKLNAVEGGLNSAQNLSNAFFSLAQAAAGKDAKKQLELKKKQFKVDKAFNLVRATIDGIRSVQAALTQTPPLSYVLAAFNGVMAAANIAKIASSKFEGETGGGGGGGGDIPTAMTAPTINAPSSSSTQLNADGSVKPSGGQITSRVIVVESDITNKQRQVASMQQNASV
jgi:hypothetical protein